MKTEEFCEWVRGIRDSQISRREFARKYPWHENTLKNYDKDRLPDVDYLYAVHLETNHDFNDLLLKRLQSGVLMDFQLDPPRFGVEESPAPYRSEGRTQKYVSKDDSMEPTIMRDSECLLDCSDRRLQEGKIYGIKYNDQFTIRRVQSDLNGGFLLLSDNPHYKTVSIPGLENQLDKLSVIGRVVRVTNSL